MSLLVLNDDELALLRFTGDLFFARESPLFVVERDAVEPANYAGSYQALVDRGIIDPHGFRITDDALNQIAPVTECDARIVHLTVDETGAVTQQDHWLLDEIAVAYERHGEGDALRHVFGPDLDPHQLVQHLGRQLVPRRAGGERFDATLTALEIMATVLLLDAVGRGEGRSISHDDAARALAEMPADDGFAAIVPGGLHAGLHPGLQTALPATLPALVAPGRLAPPKKPSAKEPRGNAAVIAALIKKGVLHDDGFGLRLHQCLFTVASGGHRRHTLVRTDFRDDDWMVREITLLPVDGSLLVIAPTRGGFRIAELDGDAMFDVLREATGPHVAGDRPPPEPQRLAALLAGQPRRA